MDSPKDLRAVSSLEVDSFLKSKNEEIKQEIGIAIGKIWGIWYSIYIKMLFISLEMLMNLAISFNLVIKRMQMKLHIEKIKVAKYDFSKYLQTVGIFNILINLINNKSIDEI